MTLEEDKKSQNKSTKKPTQEETTKAILGELESLRLENASYKTLLSMQNKSYFRAELIEALLKLDSRFEDMNKILLAIHNKHK